MVGDDFAGSVHVSTQDLASASDMAIWTFARDNGLAILSKDADFHHLSFLHGAPPKVIWIRLGNCSTTQIADCLLRNRRIMETFLADREAALLVLE